MNEVLTSFIAFALCFSGMAALGLAMDRHYEQVTGRNEPPQRLQWALRLLGWALLVASVGICLVVWGPGVGMTAWCGWLTAGALAVSWPLPYAPRWTVGMALLFGITGIMALAFSRVFFVL